MKFFRQKADIVCTIASSISQSYHPQMRMMNIEFQLWAWDLVAISSINSSILHQSAAIISYTSLHVSHRWSECCWMMPQSSLPYNINLLGFGFMSFASLYCHVCNLITLNCKARSWLDRVRIHIGKSLIMHKNRVNFKKKISLQNSVLYFILLFLFDSIVKEANKASSWINRF